MKLTVEAMKGVCFMFRCGSKSHNVKNAVVVQTYDSSVERRDTLVKPISTYILFLVNVCRQV